MTIVEILPLSIMGIGTRDITLIYLLGLNGIGPELAISFSTGILCLYLIISTMGFTVGLSRKSF